MICKVKVIALMTLALLTPMSLMAAERTGSFDTDKWYFGVGVGRSDFDGQSVDDSEVGSRIFAGYKLKLSHVCIGGEVSFSRFGSVNSKYFSIDAGNVYTEFEMQSFSLSLIAGVPFSESLDFFAKVGVSLWDIDIVSTDIMREIEEKDSDGDIGLTIGLGLEHHLTDNFSLIAEWDHTTHDTNLYGTNKRIDTNLFSVNVAYYF